MDKIITYKEALSFEHSKRGAYKDLNYRPVFRASGIFIAMVNSKINTHVCFMNYFRDKNSNHSVSTLITLRDQDGIKIFRDYFPLEEFVYQIDVKSLVQRESFIGSFEVEFFSSTDLKYPFPAIDVYYETPDGISFVHSNQRVFNDIEDCDRNTAMNAWQTSFDIYVNDKYSAYLSIINGPRKVENSRVALKIINIDGEQTNATIDIGHFPAYGARLLLLREIPWIRDFLKGKPGFCKANFETSWVFTRVACGNMACDESRMSVTHSFYDCNGHADYYSKNELSKDEFVCFFPFNLVDKTETIMIFYPTFAKSTLIFSLNCYGRDGLLRRRIEKFGELDSNNCKMIRINVRELLHKHGVIAETGLYCLDIDSADNRVPARLTFGLNYEEKGLGCNISTSVWMNKAYGQRRKIYLWGSLIMRENGENQILISHLSKIKNSREEANFSLKLISASGCILKKTYKTCNGQALNIRVEDFFFDGCKPQHNEIIWYVIESNSSDYVANQIHISESGFIGGDHSF